MVRLRSWRRVLFAACLTLGMALYVPSTIFHALSLSQAAPNDVFDEHSSLLSPSSRMRRPNNVAESRELEALRRTQYKEITFTNYGWFNKNASAGLMFPRSLVSRDLVDAILSNPRYNSSAWNDLESHPDQSRPIVALLDVETCKDVHWPRFGQDRTMASDLEGGRVEMKDRTIPCNHIRDALRSPAMASPQSRLVVLSCMEAKTRTCHHNLTKPTKLVVVHRSAHKSDVHPENDFGIAPLPVKAATLNEAQLESIRSCSNETQRKHLFSFVGRERIFFPEFHRYFRQINGRYGVQAIFQWSHYRQNGTFANSKGDRVISSTPVEEQAEDFYLSSATDSVFAGAPRGDSLTSVRFSELLSTGAIPVVYADGWVLPYTKHLVDWSTFCVILPQKDVRKTLQVINSIPPLRRCEMQRKALWVYKEYVADSKARLRGILDVLDTRLEGTGSNPNLAFAFAPGEEIFPFDEFDEREDFSESMWSGLNEKAKEDAKLLGFTKELWDSDSSIPLHSTPLEELSPREKAAAINFRLGSYFATKPVTNETVHPGAQLSK